MPLPERPSTATTSPASTSRLTPSRIRRSARPTPSVLTMPRASRTGMRPKLAGPRSAPIRWATMSATLPIERRSLGRSELTIPRVALGCGNFGGVGSAPELFGQGLSQDQAFALMDAAWEQGIDHFDTADAYGGGRSERMIGAWMRSRGVRPMLTTKTYNPMDAGADHGLAPERIARQLESSLERLGVEHVDLYLAHEFDPDVPLAGNGRGVRRVRGGGQDPRLRGQQLRCRPARGGARRRDAGRGPERALAAGARRRGRGAAAVRARARVLPRVQPARRRLADRQVPPRTSRSRRGRG